MREDVVPVDEEPILSSYDIILANSSAGKDSLAMLWPGLSSSVREAIARMRMPRTSILRATASPERDSHLA